MLTFMLRYIISARIKFYSASKGSSKSSNKVFIFFTTTLMLQKWFEPSTKDDVALKHSLLRSY